MYLSKVEDQRLQLVGVRFRHQEMQEKRDKLERECESLIENINVNQIALAEENATVFTLRKELKELKAQHDVTMYQLAEANTQIREITLKLHESNQFIDDDKHLSQTNDELEVKDDMIKCLQEELVTVGLKQAETWATIRDLKSLKQDLERDKDKLSRGPSSETSVAKLQQELMAARLRESNQSLEFDELKREMSRLKQEIQDHCSRDTEKSGGGGGDVKLSGGGAFWAKTNHKKISNHVIDLNTNTKYLEDEADYLRSKVLPELELQIRTLNSNIVAKDLEKSILKERWDSVMVKDRSNDQILVERQRQCQQLATMGSSTISDFATKSCDKDLLIEQLQDKLRELETCDNSGDEVKDEAGCSEDELKSQIIELERNVSELRSQLRDESRNLKRSN